MKALKHCWCMKNDLLRCGFSGLVNNYLRAADGLDDDCRFEEQLHEVTNLWARDDKAVSEYDLCIETSHIGDKPHQVLVCWYETMHEALSTGTH
jgi:hypothetical protein